jgi:AmmeMemoRadiSam system protein A
MYEGLLKIARDTLNCHFNHKKLIVNEKLKEKYNEKKSCFITLTINNELRGCIGSLYPKQELWKDVIDNVLNASFEDYRFDPLTKEELDDLKIEISVICGIQRLEYKDSKDLLDQLDDQMGIILKKGNYCSTFLPQVWEQIPDKTKFMNQLALKAGLSKDSWKNAQIFFYRVEKIKEE